MLDALAQFGVAQLALGGLVLSLLFLVFTRWTDSPLGRVLGIFFSVMLVFLGVVFYHNAFGPIPPGALRWIRATLYNAMGAAFWIATVGFIRIQFRTNRRDRESVDDIAH